MTTISVLCPTRERPQQLRDSIKGLFNLAGLPGAVEVLVAADADDDTIPDDLPARVVRFPERHGYPHLEVYYNTLAELAKGDWLFIWNDDATMETQGWDLRIRESPPGFLWAKPCNPKAESYHPSEFPVIPAAWYRHVGRLAGHHSVDMWLARVALASETGIHIPVTINHCVEYERSTVGYPSFHTVEMEAERQKDVEKILELITGSR